MSMGVLTAVLPFLPTCPGVYRMLDAQGRDLYIGKAKNLQKRVSSYTHLSRLPPRLQQMVHRVEQVRIITTEGEIEALLLEAQLIKAHGPTYNILLKNGYALPYLSLSTHLFPRLEISLPSLPPQSPHRRSVSHGGSAKSWGKRVVLGGATSPLPSPSSSPSSSPSDPLDLGRQNHTLESGSLHTLEETLPKDGKGGGLEEKTCVSQGISQDLDSLKIPVSSMEEMGNASRKGKAGGIFRDGISMEREPSPRIPSDAITAPRELSLDLSGDSYEDFPKSPSQTRKLLWMDPKNPENPLEYAGDKHLGKTLGKIKKQDPLSPDHPRTRSSSHLKDPVHSRQPQNPRSGVSSSLSRGSLAPKNASWSQDGQATTGGGQAGGGSQGHQGTEKPLGEKHPTPWKMGPFLSRKPLILMKDILHRGFLLRSCSDAIFLQRRTPCLQYHIQRCSAPCVGKITPEEYGEKMMEARNFLGGKMEDLQEKLEKKMKICALRHDYPQAKILRDQIWVLRDVMPMQRAAAAGKADVVGWAQASEGACLHVVSWRDGATYGCESFFFDGVSSLEGPFILSQFLRQFYTHHAPPPRLILPFLPQAWEDFSLLMRHRFQCSPHGVVPKRGPLFALGKMAQEQAADALRLHNQSRGVQRDLLAQATALFSWPALPQRIEIYDNSHLQGTSAVGVMVVYTPPQWDKKSYRTWSVEGAEDCAMMREVMRRRFDLKNLPLPDAMIIDGGKGQLSAVKSVLRDLGLSIPLLGIAKTPGKDTLILAEGKALDLPTHHPLLHWVQGLRDEAHGFALRTHRRKRQAKTLPPPSRSRPARPQPSPLA